MSDLWERAVNFYHLRLVPTVKRMLDRRRAAYTLLTVVVLLISAAALSLLLCHTAEALSSLDSLAADYEDYLTRYLSTGHKRSPMPEMREVLDLARGGRIAVSLLCGGVWLILSVMAVGRVMTAVMESEAYVYGLFMIYGADRKQLSRQLSVEFLLSGIPALLFGLPLGVGLYRLMGGLVGGAGSIPLSVLLSAIPVFLILILLCSTVLAKRVLGRSCMRMLEASDTSDQTVSPRRSHLGGLTCRRKTFSSAVLAFWRMRPHYISLCLVTAVISSAVFGTLSLSGQQTGASDGSPYRLYFPNGVTSDILELDYLETLSQYAAVKELSYAVGNSSEELGTHLKLTEAQNPSGGGVYLGAQYATDSVRIACGDGDTYYELGGSNPVPPEFSHIPLGAMSLFGYDLEAVPQGCAVYVFPAHMGKTLQVKVGDTVTLTMPDEKGGSLSDRVEAGGRTVTLRIADVVEVGSVVVMNEGIEVCPRITEDYLYISPTDYEVFSGGDHAIEFTAEEVYPDELFGEDTEGTCILAVPDGYFKDIAVPETVTVISPVDAVKTPFSTDGGKVTLSDETYFINRTHKGTGVYLGSEKEFLSDPNAAPLLDKRVKEGLTQYVGPFAVPMTRREYRVVSVIYMAGSREPYLILPRSEEVNYAILYNDLCAFRLGRLSADAPAMTVVEHEAYVLSSSVSFGSFATGSHLYLGTALMGDFTAAMDAAGIPLQAPLPTFAHSRVTARGSFSMGDTHYLLAEPFSDFTPNRYPQIDADQYPRYVTGVGSFYTVGDTANSSILSAREEGFFALLHEDSVGSLKAESIPVAGYYAVNDWTMLPAGEVDGELTLSKGTAVIQTPLPESCPVRVGDTVFIAVRQDTADLLSDPELMGLSGDRLLSYLIERLTYEYISVTVTAITKGETDAVVLSEDDLNQVLGQDGIYRDLAIRLDPAVSMADFLDFHTAVNALVKRAPEEVTLLYDESFITGTAKGLSSSTLLRAVGGISLSLIPLLLLASELLFFSRREEEYAILRAIGKTRGERRALFAAETGLFCIVATLVAALACPVGYGLLLMLADILGLPLPTAGFDLTLYAGVLPVVALSCLAVGIVVCGRLEKSLPEKQPLTEKGDDSL